MHLLKASSEASKDLNSRHVQRPFVRLNRERRANDLLEGQNRRFVCILPLPLSFVRLQPAMSSRGCSSLAKISSGIAAQLRCLEMLSHKQTREKGASFTLAGKLGKLSTFSCSALSLGPALSARVRPPRPRTCARLVPARAPGRYPFLP